MRSLTLASLGWVLTFFLLFANSALPARAQQDPYSGQPAGSQQGVPPPTSSPSRQPYATESHSSCNSLRPPSPYIPISWWLASSPQPAIRLKSRRRTPGFNRAGTCGRKTWQRRPTISCGEPSVKALLPFPPVLQNLASNLSWTSELGDAYYNQQTDVMNAIQTLRQQAKKAGTLKSSDQIEVTEKDHYISIEARQPQQEVYVPQYDPWLAYGPPIAPWPGWVETPGLWWDGPGLYFGLGFGLGPWWGYGWGWPMWGMNWYGHGIWFNRGPYFGRGPAFFNRYNYYRGNPGFARPAPYERGFSRGYAAPRPGLGMRSGPFGGYSYGGSTRNFSSRGQGSVGGGFRGGGFPGGRFSGRRWRSRRRRPQVVVESFESGVLSPGGVAMLRRAERVFLLVLVTMSLAAAAAFGAGAAPQTSQPATQPATKPKAPAQSQTAQAASAQPRAGPENFQVAPGSGFRALLPRRTPITRTKCW